MKRLLIIALFGYVSAVAEDLFVTPTGAGSANGSDWANAWSYANFNTQGNWGAGAGKISAGDTIYFSGGASGETYTGQCTFRAAGSDGNRITLKPGAAHPTLSSGHDGRVTISGMVEDNGYDYVGIDGTWPGFPMVATADQAGALETGDYKWTVTRAGAEAPAQGIHYVGDYAHYIAIEVAECGPVEIPEQGNNHGFYSNPNTGQEPVGVLISRCLVRDNRGDGINNTRSSAVSTTAQTVEFSHFVGNLQDGIQASCGITLQFCYVDGTGTGEGHHGDGWQAASGGKMVVDGNIFEAWPQTLFIETSGGDADMTDIRITNNRFFYTGNFGYMAGVLIGCKYTADNVTVGFTNLIVANNTFYGLTNRNQFKFGFNNTGAYTNCQTFIRTSLIANNIFFNSDPAWSPLNFEESADVSATDFPIQNNVFYGNTLIVWDGVSYADVAALVAAHPSFTGNNELEPSFTSTPPAAWTLSEGDTAAIDQGLDLSAYFTTDFTGATRAAPWDIGAYEYQPPTAPSRVITGTVTLSGKVL